MTHNVRLQVTEKLQLEIAAPGHDLLTVQLNRLAAQVLAARLKSLAGGDIPVHCAGISSQTRGMAFGTKVEPKPRRVRSVSLK